MYVFEILMLVCFGFAWPTAIYKSLKTKSVKGKSVLFLYIIMFGYIFGILNKIINHPDYIIALYAFNFLMVFTDLLLYYKHKKLADVEV